MNKETNREREMDKNGKMKAEQYRMMNRQLREILRDVPYKIANLANASALLYQTLEDINWSGFYLLEDGKLVLGPFQGKPACIEIQVGRGVCGTAVAQNKVVLVPDVHQFPGHIACDAASRSEIVVPLHGDGGAIVGVLDVDSPISARFDEEDQKGLEEFAKILEEMAVK